MSSQEPAGRDLLFSFSSDKFVLGPVVEEGDIASNSVSNVLHQDSILQSLPLSLPSDTTNEETKMVACRNGLFGSGVIGVDAFPVVVARVVSKVDSLGDAAFDLGLVGLVSQSSHVDFETDPRSAERELGAKEGEGGSNLFIGPCSWVFEGG